ncbi:hypothetical protein GLP21_12620 [Photobacterium carnosum]|uniref:Uncharacterized protein n=1 Tax=Photobacterium carnosum TaxID=2023717 RepID=A0A2N4UWA7_9GAMM|nr:MULTISPECIES: hypothetical protein [Photobacterium]MCD9477234.1 hypothetical protein [Photobacterium phosphoreum]MCD9485959.1 hypothetical protein [Photobacterium iliopiscarium]MCD9508779.1 hypothetical protein [Photobacterium phosphoreum]MCD9539312.1 hypothetical protein [Photobacterium carnosum]MCD9543031.1 hypothetical protein [Photobacterium carnosum]
MFNLNEIAFKHHKVVINKAIASKDPVDIDEAKEYLAVLLQEFDGSWFNTASFIGCSLVDIRILA